MDLRELSPDEQALINDTANKYKYQSRKRKNKKSKIKYKRIWFFQTFKFWIIFVAILPFIITGILLITLSRIRDNLGDDVYNEILNDGADSETKVFLSRLGLDWINQIAYLEHNKINIIAIAFLVALVIILLMSIFKIIQIRMRMKGIDDDGEK